MGISSVDTAMITYLDGTQEVIKAPRPIYDKTRQFIQPEVFDSEGTQISWYGDGYIEMIKKDGTRIFWWEPPTIEDVEVNIQYNKNKNINVLKNPIFLFIVYVLYNILFYYYII